MAFPLPPPIDIEPVRCPEAVVEWFEFTAPPQDILADATKKKDLCLKAKKHLRFLGWTFWYSPKKGGWELRYKSPTGKNYVSLRRACEACIAAGGGEPQQENNHPSSATGSSNHEKNKKKKSESLDDKLIMIPPKRVRNSDYD